MHLKSTTIHIFQVCQKNFQKTLAQHNIEIAHTSHKSFATIVTINCLKQKRYLCRICLRKSHTAFFLLCNYNLTKCCYRLHFEMSNIVWANIPWWTVSKAAVVTNKTANYVDMNGALTWDNFTVTFGYDLTWGLLNFKGNIV